VPSFGPLLPQLPGKQCRQRHGAVEPRMGGHSGLDKGPGAGHAGHRGVTASQAACSTPACAGSCFLLRACARTGAACALKCGLLQYAMEVHCFTHTQAMSSWSGRGGKTGQGSTRCARCATQAVPQDTRASLSSRNLLSSSCNTFFSQIIQRCSNTAYTDNRTLASAKSYRT